MEITHMIRALALGCLSCARHWAFHALALCVLTDGIPDGGITTFLREPGSTAPPPQSLGGTKMLILRFTGRGPLPRSERTPLHLRGGAAPRKSSLKGRQSQSSLLELSSHMEVVVLPLAEKAWGFSSPPSNQGLLCHLSSQEGPVGPRLAYQQGTRRHSLALIPSQRGIVSWPLWLGGGPLVTGGLVVRGERQACTLGQPLPGM